MAGVAEGSRVLAKHILNISLPKRTKEFKFGFEEGALLLLIVLMLVGVYRKVRVLRWVTLLGGLVLIGFILNSPLTIGKFCSPLLGFFPSFRDHLVWYILVVGIPLITLITGRNLYCQWLCPFGALQEIISKISGKNVTCSGCVTRRLRMTKFVLAYGALFLGILLADPGKATYEPFAAIFALQGSSLQWFMLPIILFSAFFFSRLWCRFLCPVSPVLDGLGRTGRRLRNLFKRRGVDNG